MNFIKCLAAVAFSATLASVTNAADGMIAVKSAHNAKTTIDRLENTVKTRGLIIFARIDHADGAAKLGKTMRPTELLIFGHPKGGAPFMECAQTVGIDLPIKALAWEDTAGQVWLGYNDTSYVAKRHGVPECLAAANMGKMLTGLVEAVVAP
jgi:uncharacterized protein (DUF302 family)